MRISEFFLQNKIACVCQSGYSYGQQKMGIREGIVEREERLKKQTNRMRM